jgi:four helix bundle protein
MNSQELYERLISFGSNSLKLFNLLREQKVLPDPVLLQFIRSSTSIGANYAEAKVAGSRRDFIHKLGISFKELHETNFWIAIFSKNIELKELDFLKKEADELLRIFTASMKKLRGRNR